MYHDEDYEKHYSPEGEKLEYMIENEEDIPFCQCGSDNWTANGKCKQCKRPIELTESQPTPDKKDWRKILDEKLDELGWIVKPHGHFNGKGELQCACRAGDEYKKEKEELVHFFEQVESQAREEERKELKWKIDTIIAEEMLICMKEGQPTSRLTSLGTKIQALLR